MITLKIYITSEGLYRFLLFFRTRFFPAILFGKDCADRKSCLDEIRVVVQQILSEKNLAFTKNNKGERFTVLSPDRKPIAYSSYFATPKLLKRILCILQNRIVEDLSRLK